MDDENAPGTGDALEIAQPIHVISPDEPSPNAPAIENLPVFCREFQSQLELCQAEANSENLQRLDVLSTKLLTALDSSSDEPITLEGYRLLTSALSVLRRTTTTVRTVTRVNVSSRESSADFHAQVERAVGDIRTMFNLSPTTTIETLAFELRSLKQQYDLSNGISEKAAKLTEENVNLRLNCRNLEEEVRQLREFQSAQDDQVIELRRERDELKEEAAQRSAASLGSLMEPELRRLKSKLNEAEKQIEKAKAKSKQMKSALNVSSAKVSELQRINESLKILNQRLTLDNEDLKAKLTNQAESVNQWELEAKQTQVDALQTALTQLAEQLSDQTEEIAEYNEQKNVLMTTLSSQRVMADQMEKLLRDRERVIGEHKKELQLLKIELEKKEQEKEDAMEAIDDAIGLIRDFAINNMTEARAHDISKILDRGDTAAIVSAFEYVNKLFMNARSEDVQELCGTIGEQNKRLLGYLQSQNDYLISVAGDESIHSDLRKEIIQACSEVDTFLQENASGLVAEFNVFNVFGLSVQANEMAYQLSQFFQKFDETLSPDANELMVVLRHAVSMNLILKQFDSILKDQCEYQVNEMTRMRNELADLRELASYENEATIADLTTEVNELKTELDAVKAQSIQLQQPIQATKADKRGKLDEKKELEEALVKSQKAQRLLKKKLVSSETELESLRDECAKLQTRINDILSTTKDLQSQKDALEKYTSELKQVILLEKEKNEELNRELKLNVESVKTELEDVKREYSERVNAQDRNWRIEVQKLKDQHKERLAKVQNEAIVLTERLETLKTHYNQIITDMKEKNAEARSAEKASTDKLRQVELTLKETKSTMSQLNIENKMLKLQLDSLKEKAKRDQIQASNQVRARQISIQSEIEDKANALKAEHDREMHSFFAAICDRFRDFVVFDKPITREHVDSILDKVAASCSKSLDFERRFQNTQTELDKLRTILKVKNKISITSAVDHLISDNERLSAQNQKLQTELDEYGSAIIAARSANNQAKEVKEWSQWARRLLSLTSSALQVGRSDKQVRQSLEEFLLPSLTTRCCVSWKLDSLRLQKSLLQSDALSILPASIKRPSSIRPVLAAFAALHRMQKLSGHLHPTLSLAPADAPAQPRRWPLFTPA